LIIIFFIKYREGRNLEKLVKKRIISISRIQSNLETAVMNAKSIDFKLMSAEFNFRRMLRRIIDKSTLQANESGRNLSAIIDDDVPETMTGDAQRLAHVINNLLESAIVLTPYGKDVSLSVQLLKEEKDNYTIKILISGIIDDAKLSAFSSHGLDLSISQYIAEKMGSKIYIESKPDKKTTFSFSVQMKKGYTTSSVSKEKLPLTNIKILAADSNPELLEYLKEIVQGFGAHCDVTMDSEDALRLIRRNGNYDMYFIDWKMPGTAKKELKDILYENEFVPNETAIITMSSIKLSNKKCQRDKCAKFLLKPFFQEDVWAVINNFLN